MLSDLGNARFPRTAALAEGVTVDWQNEVAETLIMGLRLTNEGIGRNSFRKRFGIDLVDLHRTTLEKYAGYGLLTIEPDMVRLTSRGRLLSNMIFRELI
jgi:oxygen-independent coproporphyrinogen-3 oxidase